MISGDTLPNMRTDLPHVVVVGGGIAGLAAAHRLIGLAPKVAVTVIEARPRFGGTIVTERTDGFVIEGGPDSFLAAKPRGIELCEELGLAERLQGTAPRRRRAFVLRKGHLHDLPEGLTGLIPTRLGPMLRSRLFSPVGKARLALDYVLPPLAGDADEALAAFVRRRLGPEVYDRLVEPLMAGIYAGDGERLSLAATFPQLRRAELTHGSLIKGIVAARRSAFAPGGSRPAFLTPSGGLGELIDTLTRALEAAGVRLETGRPAVRIESIPSSRDGRYRIVFAHCGALEADAVVVAVPAPAAGQLLRLVDPALAADLGAIPHASSAIVTLGYRRDDVPHPLDGYGYVVPRAERRPVLACTWSSAKWAHRAPPNRVLLRVFVGRFGQDEAVAGDDGALIGLARGEIREVLGVEAAPLLDRVHRWPAAMPQYVLGHLDRVAAIERGLDNLPGLQLAGNAYRGVGIPDCIASGEAAATAAHATATTAVHPGGNRGDSVQPVVSGDRYSA